MERGGILFVGPGSVYRNLGLLDILYGIGGRKPAVRVGETLTPFFYLVSSSGRTSMTLDMTAWCRTNVRLRICISSYSQARFSERLSATKNFRANKRYEDGSYDHGRLFS